MIHPSICGATSPSGPWPPSEGASIHLCLLFVPSILVFLGSVMCPSGRRPPTLFLVFSLVYITKFPIKKPVSNNQLPNFKFPLRVNKIIIIIIFLHGLGRLTCSGIDALSSFPGASTISSPPRFVDEGVFRKSGVVHSFEMVDPVLFVFGFYVLYSRGL